MLHIYQNKWGLFPYINIILLVEEYVIHIMPILP